MNQFSVPALFTWFGKDFQGSVTLTDQKFFIISPLTLDANDIRAGASDQDVNDEDELGGGSKGDEGPGPDDGQGDAGRPCVESEVVSGTNKRQGVADDTNDDGDNRELGGGGDVDGQGDAGGRRDYPKSGRGENEWQEVPDDMNDDGDMGEPAGGSDGGLGRDKDQGDVGGPDDDQGDAGGPHGGSVRGENEWQGVADDGGDGGEISV